MNLHICAVVSNLEHTTSKQLQIQSPPVVVALQTTSWLTHHISVTTGDLSKLGKKYAFLRGPWKWVVTHREFPELFYLKAPKIYPDHSSTYVGLSVSKKTKTLKMVYLHRC